MQLHWDLYFQIGITSKKLQKKKAIALSLVHKISSTRSVMKSNRKEKISHTMSILSHYSFALAIVTDNSRLLSKLQLFVFSLAYEQALWLGKEQRKFYFRTFSPLQSLFRGYILIIFAWRMVLKQRQNIN